MLILKPSQIHGVGVFTTWAIRKGTKVQLFTPRDWIHAAQVRGAQRRYCPTAKGGGFYAPRDFHRMSIGWYLNHSTHPNVDARCNTWRALRFIRPGQELTIDYQFVDER